MAMNEGNNGSGEEIWEVLDDLGKDELMEYAEVLESEPPPTPSIEIARIYVSLYKETKDSAHLSIGLGHLNDALTTSSEKDEELIRRVAQSSESLLLIATSGFEPVLDAVLMIDGTLIERRDINGQTPLHQAAATGNLTAVEMLVSVKANINAVDFQSGLTPLHMAVRNGHKDVVHSLLQNGSNPNVQSPGKFSLLHQATFLGFEDIVSLLVAAGANVDSMDENGGTALHVAAKQGYKVIAEILLSENRGNRTLKINGYNGWTPLQQALVFNQSAVAEVLLAHGAWADLKDDTYTHLDEIANGNIMDHIERAQQLMIQDPTIFEWAKSLRFVVRDEKSSIEDPKLKLIEPGEEGTAAEPYVAVSYCWSQPTRPNKYLQIEVPSRTKPGETEMRETRAISEVLNRALDFAASKGINRIWIDQECIHQDDPVDVGKSIQNMHLVYKQAKYTLVLLGDHIQSVTDIQSLSQLTSTSDQFNALKLRIVQDKWFTRAWTIQELATSPRENIVFLVGWKNGLDEEGVEWNKAVSKSQIQVPPPQQTASREWELTCSDISSMAFTGSYEGLSQIEALYIRQNETSGNKVFTLIDEEVKGMRWYRRGAMYVFLSLLSTHTFGLDN